MGEGHQAFLTEYLHVAMQFFKGDEIFVGGGGGCLLYAVFGSGYLWIRTVLRSDFGWLDPNPGGQSVPQK
jgi:hypothetical protein